MATAAISIGVSVGLGLLSRELFEDESPDEVFDDKPTQLAKRGTFIPLIIGRRRTPGVFGWAGRRWTNTFESSEGGKGSDTVSNILGVEGPRKTNYYEDGWHLICPGPVEKLITVRVAGVPIFSTPFTRTGSPSGSFLFADPGSIRHEDAVHNINYHGFFFWGEIDQPINNAATVGANNSLAHPDRLGIASRWPSMCYMMWTAWAKGQTPQWPFIDYEVVVEPKSTVLTMSPKFLDETVADKGDEGANPAHALWQILTEPFPHGCGIDPNRLNTDAFELFGQIAEDEHLPVNLSATNGREAVQIIAELMQDMGAMFPQIGNEVFPYLVRPPLVAVPDFTDDVIIPPLPEFTTLHGNVDTDRIIFTYKDLKNNYRDIDIQIDDDGQADSRGVSKAKKLPIATVTDFDTAVKIADRRQAEELGRAKYYTIKATRGARVLRAGNVITVSGLGQLIVLSIELTDDSNEVSLECVVDAYSIAASSFAPDTPAIPDAFAPAVADFGFTFIEAPRVINDSRANAIMVARIRSRRDIIGARIHGSGDGSTFEQIGSQDSAAIGGRIIEPFPKNFAGGDLVIEQTVAMGSDFDRQLDLLEQIRDFSADEVSWRNGRQVMLIDDEIMFLRNIVAISGNVFRLDGVIRARYDTLRQDHASNEKVFIFNFKDLALIGDVILRDGVELSVKDQPRSANSIVSLGALTPVVKTLTARSTSPIPPANFRGNDDDSGRRENFYVAGGDIRFDWNYNVVNGFGSAAGEKLAGEPISDDTLNPDGFFKIEIIDPAGPTVVRTIEIGKTGAPFDTVVYTNAELVADFSGEPATFDASLRNVDGALRSAARVVSVTKQ